MRRDSRRPRVDNLMVMAAIKVEPYNLLGPEQDTIFREIIVIFIGKSVLWEEAVLIIIIITNMLI